MSWNIAVISCAAFLLSVAQFLQPVVQDLARVTSFLSLVADQSHSATSAAGILP
jgi:hypothetical protein